MTERYGENVHAWKACIPQKGIPSSNLGHSAKILQAELPVGFFCNMPLKY